MLTLGNVTFDCADPQRLAEFWSKATGYELAESSPFMTRLTPSGGGRPNLLFIKVPEPKRVKNRQHLDFGTTDIESEVERLVTLGATRRAQHHEYGFAWTVLADPEGNEFCVGHPDEA